VATSENLNLQSGLDNTGRPKNLWWDWLRKLWKPCSTIGICEILLHERGFASTSR
jgi:hypothetical protein